MTSDDLWPHQRLALDAIVNANYRGVRRLCLVIPTGGGKTRVAVRSVQQFLELGLNAIFYTNRKALLDQTSRVFADVPHGIRAAGHDTNLHLPFQISSFMTENNRVLKSDKWKIHPAAIVFVDEAHQNTGKTARQIISRHWTQGAMIVGLTATPLDLGDLYEELAICGSNSSLRACGALVPSRHYGPDEPDMEEYKLAAKPTDRLTEAEIKKAVMTKGIFGRVLEQFNIINPERRPTILFGPGVKESLYFAQQFSQNGIPFAHIDGDDIWVAGELHRNTTSLRNEIFADSKAGRIVGISNRFVLREGIDAPWLSHGIFATIFGSLQAYLQSGGRLLRSAPGKRFCTIQDHGGNWWRHLSLNINRQWIIGQKAEWMSELIRSAMRKDLSEWLCIRCKVIVAADQDVCSCGVRRTSEPWSCPRCNKIMVGIECECGFKRERMKFPRRVLQSDGKMTEHVEKLYQPKRTAFRDDTFEKWKECYFRCKSAGRTFRQALGLFVQEEHYYPPRTLKFMPKDEYTWFLKIKDVSWEKLI